MNIKGKLSMSFQRHDDETLIKGLNEKQLYRLEKDIRVIVRDSKTQMRKRISYVLEAKFSRILIDRYFKFEARISYEKRPNIDVEVITLEEFKSKDEFFKYVNDEKVKTDLA